MSNENSKQWYKNPYIIIPAIVVILAAIIGPAIAKMLESRPSDFSTSIAPMEGAVQQDGFTQTTISVKGINGYEHPVSLSASGQPSGTEIAFNPPSGDAMLGYTATMSVSVNSKVPAGEYIITTKGTGADGKEHSCKYTLRVIKKPPPTTVSISSTTSSTTLPIEAYMVFSDSGIAAGDVWDWSGTDWGLESPLLVDGSHISKDAPEGTKCFKVTSGSGQNNYVGWGVFLGTFKNHELISPHTVDLSDYKNLEFKVKTPVDLKVELQQDNADGIKSSSCLISNYGWNGNSPNAWQEITIPKSAFRGVDITKVFCPFMITGNGSKVSFCVDKVFWVP